MWGNGTANELDTYSGKVKEICDAKGVTLIIINRPNSTASSIQSNYAAKKAIIDKYIAMGVRYVDSAIALSTNPSSADGWYSGFLSSDGLHPTLLGYEALAFQVLNDIPELMQY